MGTGSEQENNIKSSAITDHDPDEETFPDWLTNSFLEDILRWHFHDDDLTILRLQAENLQTKGICFSSILYRILIDFKTNDRNDKFYAIIKAHPNGSVGVVARKNQLFQREILVYKEILPRVRQLLHTIDDDHTQISPKCFYTTENPEPMLILEDMQQLNFQMFEKNRLFNLEHCLAVMHKLAKLHAATAVLHQQDSKMMNFFCEGPISSNPDRQEFLGFFPANIKSLATEVSKWPGYEEISKKLFDLEKTVLSKAIEMFEGKTESSSFKVLNLGDLWINNLMFTYDGNNIPEDVVLFDYQLSYFGSPAIDLNYFIYGSINENVRKVHYKFIVREYHQQLNKTLTKLNYQGCIPTLKDIHIQIIQNSLHGVIAAVCLTPLIFMESEKFDSLDGLFESTEKGDAFRTVNIRNPKYKQFIQRTLKEFELSGFLD